jgi:hypothetical protein
LDAIPDADIIMGATIFANTDLSIRESGVVTIENGGRLINSGMMTLSGTIDNDGALENSGVIKKVGTGSVIGRVTGQGFIASEIVYTSTDPSISISSSDDTVLVANQGGTSPPELTIALLNGSRTTMATPLPGTAFTSPEFLFSLRDRDILDGFDLAFEIGILGISDAALRYSDMTVSVRAYVPSGFSAEVYSYDQATKTYVDYLTVEPELGWITFPFNDRTVYQVKYVDSGEGDGGDDRNYIIIGGLVVGIIIVAVLTVHTAIRKPAPRRRRFVRTGGRPCGRHRRRRCRSAGAPRRPRSPWKGRILWHRSWSF